MYLITQSPLLRKRKHGIIRPTYEGKMAANNQLRKLMETPMSRKQFLRYMGIMFLSVLGVGIFISAILKGHHKAAPALKERSGFGGGKYGV